MRILSVGNSYSEDAQAFVHQIAAASGADLTVCNLYYGGCSLDQHLQFHRDHQAAYAYARNGAFTGEAVTLLQGLAKEPWDIVTLQQTSRTSMDISSFQPALSELAQVIRTEVPAARIFLHATWGYCPDSSTLKNYGFARNEEMYAGIGAAYREAARFLNDAPILPTGKAILLALQNGVPGALLFRDDIHLSLTLGRYLAGATWYAALTGRSAAETGFAPPLSPAGQAFLPLVRQCADLAVQQGA